MIKAFDLELLGSPQIVPIIGGLSGYCNIYIAFDTYPSSGTVSVDIQRPGSSAWVSASGASPATIVSGGLNFLADGGISAVRVTFASLTGGTRPRLFITENVTANPSSNLITDGGFGPSARLRVDPGQTGFFAGRMFRSFLQGVVPVAGPTVQFRIVSPIDFVLWSNEISLTQGAVQMSLYTNATPSGTWTKAPTIGVNRMQSRPQPYYESPIYLESGGDFTGGTLVDPVPLRAPAGNNNADNVKESASERGLPAGTYYGRISTLTGGLQVNDDAHFTYKPSWEDRPT